MDNTRSVIKDNLLYSFKIRTGKTVIPETQVRFGIERNRDKKT